MKYKSPELLIITRDLNKQKNISPLELKPQLRCPRLFEVTCVFSVLVLNKLLGLKKGITKENARN